MSSRLPKQVLDEINDIKLGKECYQLDQDLKIIYNNLEYFKKLSKSNVSFYLCVFEEIVTEPYLLDNLIEIIEKNNLTSAKITMSTNQKFKYSTHPLTNIAMWACVTQRNKVEYYFGGPENTKSVIFSDKHFNYKNMNVNENRKYKSIFSVRRKNQYRDFLFSNINLGNSICRYAEAIVNDEGVLSYNPNKNINNFPTLSELIKEYYDSYISIVCETNNTGIISKFQTPQFSEKSLVAFLSGTMPLMFGGKNLIKNFKDMGLYTWNDYFGYDGDEFWENESVISFKNCINKVSNLNTNDVKKIYIENKDKIQSNVDIISDLMSFKIDSSNMYKWNYITDNFKIQSKIGMTKKTLL